jgi:hypothetical protein
MHSQNNVVFTPLQVPFSLSSLKSQEGKIIVGIYRHTLQRAKQPKKYIQYPTCSLISLLQRVS